jgi:hypothetical protein
VADQEDKDEHASEVEEDKEEGTSMADEDVSNDETDETNDASEGDASEAKEGDEVEDDAATPEDDELEVDLDDQTSDESEQASSGDFDSEESDDADAGSNDDAPNSNADEDSDDSPFDEDGTIGGVFNPDSVHETGDDPDVNLQNPYLHKEDIDYEDTEWNPAVVIMGTLLVLLTGGFMYFLMTQTEQGKRVKALLQGNLKEYERAKARRAKQKWKEEMLSQLPKYGTLTLRTTNKQYKYSKIRLNGEVQYGKLSHPLTEDSFHKYEQQKDESGDSGGEDANDETAETDSNQGDDGGKKGKGSEKGDGGMPKVTEWRAVRLRIPSTKFQNLNVEEKHGVEVRAPNYKPKEWELTEGAWTEVEGSTMNYKKKLNVNMVPRSGERQIELQQRLKKDPENNYHGKVEIKTIPSGARVMFNNEPLLNEEGEEMKTPVTFKKFYIRNEEDDELEEKKIRVDTKPGRGHKIQVRMPDSEGDYPNFITSLERQMWTCNWKEESKIEALPDDAPYPKRCNYTFDLEVDFKGMKDYIEEQKKEKKEVKERNEKLRNKLEELRKKRMKQ